MAWWLHKNKTTEKIYCVTCGKMVIPEKSSYIFEVPPIHKIVIRTLYIFFIGLYIHRLVLSNATKSTLLTVVMVLLALSIFIGRENKCPVCTGHTFRKKK